MGKHDDAERRYAQIEGERDYHKKRADRLEEERDALAAHVERVLQAWNAEQDGHELFNDAWVNYVGDVIEAAPTTSLARLKAEWQADLLDEIGPGFVDIIDRSQARAIARTLRCQAEEASCDTQ